MKVGMTTHDWDTVEIDGENQHILRGVGWVRLGQFATGTTLDFSVGRLVWHPVKHIFGVRDPHDIEYWDCDVIYDMRLMHKDNPEQIRQAQANGQVFVSDVDDWYWGGGSLTKNMNWRGLQPQSNPDLNVQHYRRVIACSDAVTISTPYLMERINWVPSSRKFLLENTVDFGEYPKRIHTENERPIIGWTGFTGLRVGDLDVLKAFYPSIAGEFRFHHSGDQANVPSFSSQVGLPDELITREPVYKFIGHYRQHAFNYDIGVVPLVDTPFNLAKSWLKGLEYTAAGIPFIASPIGEYVRLKKAYGVGRLAEKPKDWIRHLRELKDPEVRSREAAENLERLESLDLAYGIERWESIMKKVGRSG